MSTQDLIQKLNDQPDGVSFNEVIDVIANNYSYTPTRFSNGIATDQTINEAGSNEGSCKIFAFAKLNGLDQQQTLNCFGDYYRHDVLGNPNGDDHANIRTFMRHGWAGISFEQDALSPNK